MHNGGRTFVDPAAKTDIPLSFRVIITVGCLLPEVKSEALMNLKLSAASSFASPIVKDPKNWQGKRVAERIPLIQTPFNSLP